MDIEELIFENTTSWNAKDEILPIFTELFKTPQENCCSFYQGCGVDICTLLINNIDIHIFSDTQASCFDKIKNKLKRLKQHRIISNLKHPNDTESRFIFLNRQKIFRYTLNPISKINFRREYGDLRVVFEYNPGTSTMEMSFWEGIKTQLKKDGFLIGSYAKHPGQANRDAWVLTEINNRYHIWVSESISDTLKKKLEQHMKENNLPMGKFNDATLVSYGREYFLAMEVGNHNLFKKTKPIPISEFWLKLQKLGEKISIFQKEKDYPNAPP